MSEQSGLERKPAFGIRWDGTVNAGHVLLFAGWVVSAFIWGIRIETQVSSEKEARQRFEAEILRRLDRDDIRERTAFDDVRASLRRIEDLILRPPSDRRTP
jgi:hypothetical protein